MKNKLVSVDVQYLDLVKTIKRTGNLKGDRTGTGTTSIFGHSMKFDLTAGFPLLTSKEMSIKNISTELLWFMRGQTNIRPLLEVKNYIWVGDCYKRYVNTVLMLERKVSQVLANSWMRCNGDDTYSLFTRKEFIQELLENDDFNNKWGDLGAIYGKQWRDFGGIDQLQGVVDKLISNPDDRRMIVSAWKPDELVSVILPPCHVLFQFYSRELGILERREWCDANDIDLGNFAKEMWEHAMDSLGVPSRALSLMWYQRSCDTMLGIPYNIASYALLTHTIAQMTNHVVEELSSAFGDTHVYNNHWEGAEIQLTQEIHDSPTISFDPNIEWSTNLDDVLSQLTHKSFILNNYKHSPKINFPLSN